MPNTLTQRLVTQYAKYQALKNLLDKWLAERRADIVAALAGGDACPDRGPYLLEVKPASEGVSWKEEFETYLKDELKKSDIEVFQIFAAIAARPRESNHRLYCKRNPNYRRKFPINLPA